METFKIATYNVNSIRSRLHIVIPWLQENQPTVFCMQETKVEDKKFPVKEFEDAGYHVVFKGEKRYNGVAMASLERPAEISFGLDDEGPTDGDRLISGAFVGIPVINTYVPQGYDRESPRFQYKLQWFKRLKDWIERHYSPAKPLIWCGDLNVAQEEIDVHNPKRLLGMSVSTRRCGKALPRSRHGAWWMCSEGTIPMNPGSIPSSTTGSPRRCNGGSVGGWTTSWPPLLWLIHP